MLLELYCKESTDNLGAVDQALKIYAMDGWMDDSPMNLWLLAGELGYWGMSYELCMEISAVLGDLVDDEEEVRKVFDQLVIEGKVKGPKVRRRRQSG